MFYSTLRSTVPTTQSSNKRWDHLVAVAQSTAYSIILIGPHVIADGSISTPKILDSAVTENKISLSVIGRESASTVVNSKC